MHADYHSLNLLVAHTRPARVAAVLDWELATIGDPLLDLASFLRFWLEMHGAEGRPDRAQLVQWYARAAGVDVPDLAYYDVLAPFKLAVTLEGIYQRSKSDPTRPLIVDAHDYAQRLVAGATELVAAASR